MNYPTQYNPYGPASNPLSTKQKVGIGVAVAAVGLTAFFVGRKLTKDVPRRPSREQNP